MLAIESHPECREVSLIGQDNPGKVLTRSEPKARKMGRAQVCQQLERWTAGPQQVGNWDDERIEPEHSKSQQDNWIEKTHVLLPLSPEELRAWAERGDGFCDGSQPFSQVAWHPNKTSFLLHQHLLWLWLWWAAEPVLFSYIHLRTFVSHSVYISPEYSATFRLNYKLKCYQQSLQKIIREKEEGGKETSWQTHTYIHRKNKKKCVAATVFISVSGQKNIIFITSFSNCWLQVQNLSWSRFCVCVFSLLVPGISSLFFLIPE